MVMFLASRRRADAAYLSSVGEFGQVKSLAAGDLQAVDGDCRARALARFQFGKALCSRKRASLLLFGSGLEKEIGRFEDGRGEDVSRGKRVGCSPDTRE